MSDKRNPVYFAVTGASTTFLKLNLDPDLYDVDTLAKVGGFNTVASGAKVIPVNKKYAIASGLVKEYKAKCERGTGDAVKTRVVPILVGEAKYEDVRTSLVGSTLKLGQGANPVSWTVKSVA